MISFGKNGGNLNMVKKVKNGDAGWVSDLNKLYEHKNPKAESSRRKELQLQMYRAAMQKNAQKNERS